MAGTKRGARVLSGVAALAAVAALVAGCTSNPVAVDPDSGGVANATPSPGPGADGAASASPTPTPAAGIPLDLDCAGLVSADALAILAPGAALDGAFSPTADSPAAAVAELRGTTCAWATPDGQRIEVAVARLDAADVEARKNSTVSESTQVPTFNPVADEGYFTLTGARGRADAFVGDYWIVTDSTLYFEPGDAQPVVEFAAAALPR